MRKSLALGTLSLTVLFGLPACGGDDDGTGSETSGMADDTTDGGEETTTEAGEESTTTDSGDGDSSDTTETTSDTTGDGDGDTTDTTDTTGGDGDTGNTGDCAMGFSTLVSTSNDLTSSLDVSSAVLNCTETMTLTATGGSICIEDDGNGGHYYTVESIALEDIIDFDCAGAVLSLTELSISDNGTGTDVTVPSGGGDMTGQQPIIIMANISGTALGQMISDTPLEDFTGVLPEGNGTVGSDTTVTYDDTTTVIAMAAPEVDTGIVPITINVELTGLQGSLTFDP